MGLDLTDGAPHAPTGLGEIRERTTCRARAAVDGGTEPVGGAFCHFPPFFAHSAMSS